MQSQCHPNFACSVCLNKYDNKLYAPRIIPCTQGHTICVNCANKLLNDPKQHKCPVDNEVLVLNDKDISIFRECLDLKKLIGYFNVHQFCDQHPKNVLEQVCLKCKERICSRCEKHGHKAHWTEYLDEISEKAQRKSARLQEYVAKIGQACYNLDQFISQSQAFISQVLEAHFGDVVQNIMNKQKNLQIELQTYCQALLKSSLPLNDSSNPQITDWSLKTINELNKLYPQKIIPLDPDQIPFAIFEQENSIDKLKIQDWIDKQQQESMKVEMELNAIANRVFEESSAALNDVLVGYLNSQEKRKAADKLHMSVSLSHIRYQMSNANQANLLPMHQFPNNSFSTDLIQVPEKQV